MYGLLSLLVLGCFRIGLWASGVCESMDEGPELEEEGSEEEDVVA